MDKYDFRYLQSQAFVMVSDSATCHCWMGYVVSVSTKSVASMVLVSTIVHFGMDVVPVLWYWFQPDCM